MRQPSIVINVSEQRDGYVFRLRPRSSVWLDNQYPDKYRVASVFIGFDKIESRRQIQETIWHQVAQMLTGLTNEELNAIGGFVVNNPSTGQEAFDSFLVHV